FAFRRPKHHLALAVPVGDRQGLQDDVVAVALFVGEGCAEALIIAHKELLVVERTGNPNEVSHRTTARQTPCQTAKKISATTDVAATLFRMSRWHRFAIAKHRQADTDKVS